MSSSPFASKAASRACRLISSPSESIRLFPSSCETAANPSFNISVSLLRIISALRSPRSALKQRWGAVLQRRG